MTNQGTEIVKSSRLSNDDLRALTADNVHAYFAQQGVPVTDLTQVLGSGFDVLPTDKKAKLIDESFVVVEWHMSKGDKGEFVSLAIITQDGKKLILNDGSSGIRDQVKDLVGRGINAPVLVRRGLRVSEYFYNEKTGEKSNDPQDGDDWSKAQTFYLSV